MKKLNSRQRKYLRGLAHSYKPHVIVGKNELIEGSFHSISLALDVNELIKIKFNSKSYMIDSKDILISKLECHIVGDIGKILILYRRNIDKTENYILIPD